MNADGNPTRQRGYTVRHPVRASLTRRVPIVSIAFTAGVA